MLVQICQSQTPNSSLTHPPPFSIGNHQFSFFSWVWALLSLRSNGPFLSIFHLLSKWHHRLFVVLWLRSFTKYDQRQVHLCDCKRQYWIHFYLWLSESPLHLGATDASICPRTFLLPAGLGDCRLFCSEHWFHALFSPVVWESGFFFPYSFRSVITVPIGREWSVFVFIFSEGATFKPLPLWFLHFSLPQTTVGWVPFPQALFRFDSLLRFSWSPLWWLWSIWLRFPSVSP